MIIEDNVISSRMLEGILHHHELENVAAKNGQEALNLLRERNDVKLLLLDLMMPEMDGFQFLEVRGASPRLRRIPVVVMTALADAETVRRVISMGCRHYVVKPVQEDTLIAKIREILPEELPTETNVLLYNRLQVMKDQGLDDKGYDELFAAVREQLESLLETVSGEGSPFPEEDLRILAEGLTPLCGPSVPPRLNSLADGKARSNVITFLQHLKLAFDAAHDRRQRIQARVAEQQQGPV